MRYKTRMVMFAVLAMMAGGLVGCATTGAGGLTRAQAADLVITQLEATIESAEAVMTALDDTGTPPEELQLARIILAAAKPQIVAWITLIESLQTTEAQAARVSALKVRADAVVPPQEAAAIRARLAADHHARAGE